MIVQIIRLKTELSEEEVLKMAREREPHFRAIAGLLQKYYVKMEGEGEFGGVYIWDSRESLQAFRASGLAAGIAQAYRLIEPPSVEIMDVLFQLRE